MRTMKLKSADGIHKGVLVEHLAQRKREGQREVTGFANVEGPRDGTTPAKVDIYILYKDVLKFREEAAQRKTQSTEKDIGTFCADPICGELRQRNTGCYPLSTRAGARYSPVFGLRGLDLW